MYHIDKITCTLPQVHRSCEINSKLFWGSSPREPVGNHVAGPGLGLGSQQKPCHTNCQTISLVPLPTFQILPSCRKEERQCNFLHSQEPPTRLPLDQMEELLKYLDRNQTAQMEPTIVAAQPNLRRQASLFSLILRSPSAPPVLFWKTNSIPFDQVASRAIQGCIPQEVPHNSFNREISFTGDGNSHREVEGYGGEHMFCQGKSSCERKISKLPAREPSSK